MGRRQSRRVAAAALCACAVAVVAAAGLWAWHPWEAGDGEVIGGPAEVPAGQVTEKDLGQDGPYEGPLPFEGLERPLSEMPRDPEGNILADDGSTVLDGVLYAHFGPGGRSEEHMAELVEGVGLEGKNPYWHTYLDAGDIYVSVPDDVSMEEAAERLLALDEVESVELIGPNHGRIRMFEGAEAPAEDERLAVLPGIDLGEYHLAWDRFEEAWDVAKCEGRVTVAVLDTGAPSRSLDDLAPNVDYARMRDFTGGDGFDAVGHGTAVASVISAVADDDGCTGCSWDAVVLPVRIAQGEEFERLDDGNYDMSPLWGALSYLVSLDDPPDVVNMSFGAAVGEGEIKESDVAMMQRFVDRLVARGCVCVAAAGNDGGFDIEHPFNGDIDNSVNYPAACEGVVSVGSLHAPTTPRPIRVDGALVSSAWLAAFSNTASDVDLVAFGDDVQALSLGAFGLQGTSKFDGTSFAAPQVSAAAALVCAAHPRWGADLVERALTQTARDLGEAGRDDCYGYGALDAAAAVGWEDPGSGGGSGSPVLGGSILDAYREAAGRSV